MCVFVGLVGTLCWTVGVWDWGPSFVALHWLNLGFKPLWGRWVCCLIAASLLSQSLHLLEFRFWIGYIVAGYEPKCLTWQGWKWLVVFLFTLVQGGLNAVGWILVKDTLVSDIR